MCLDADACCLQMGGAQGLAEALRTNLRTGLFEDELNSALGLADRRARYGENYIPRPPPASLWALCRRTLSDVVLQILVVAGIVSLILALSVSSALANAWIQGLAMYVAFLCLGRVWPSPCPWVGGWVWVGLGVVVGG